MKYLQSPFTDEKMEVLGEGVACRLGTFTMAGWSHPRPVQSRYPGTSNTGLYIQSTCWDQTLTLNPDSEDKLIPLKAKRKQKQTNTPTTKNLSSGRIRRRYLTN